MNLPYANSNSRPSTNRQIGLNSGFQSPSWHPTRGASLSYLGTVRQNLRNGKAVYSGCNVREEQNFATLRIGRIGTVHAVGITAPEKPSEDETLLREVAGGVI